MHAHVCCVCVVLCCSNVPSVPLSPPPTVSRCLCRVLLCMLCLPSCHTCIPVVVVVTLSLPCRHDLAVVGRSSVVGRRSLVHLVVVGRRSVVVMVRFGSVRFGLSSSRFGRRSWFSRGSLVVVVVVVVGSVSVSVVPLGSVTVAHVVLASNPPAPPNTLWLEL